MSGIIAYHGTPAKACDSFVFDYKRIAKHSCSDGYGFYFTDSKEYAHYYSLAGGSIIKATLEIKKPLPLERKNFTKTMLFKIMKVLVTKEIKKYGLDSWRDSFLSNIVDTYETSSLQASILKAIPFIIEGTAVDCVCEFCNILQDKELVLETIREVTGYDSILTVHQDRTLEQSYNVFIVFTVSQIQIIEMQEVTPLSE